MLNQKISSKRLTEINQTIVNRQNVFYWQTDRAISPIEAKVIWQDRHSYFSDKEIIDAINQVLVDNILVELEPFDAEAQTNLGNVNSVRLGKLDSGKEVIIRLHPKGIANGYFYVESLAAHTALDHGLPSYQTFAIHEAAGFNDFAFQVIERLPGIAVQRWLETHPNDEDKLLFQIGKNMATVHKIKVDGFGPFNNQQAKSDHLVGLHQTLAEAVQAGLEFNLKVLKDEGLLNDKQIEKIKLLFSTDSPLLRLEQAVLVHNDFADWNLLTDGQNITGILDWDEAVAGDPIEDIACWSTFFNPERINRFLEGYWSVTQKPEDFEEKFELFRLRYIISKMTLRIRRLAWDQSDGLKERIEAGRIHLKESLHYFNI